MDWVSEFCIKDNIDSEEDNQQSQNTSIDQEEITTSLDISRDSLDSDVDDKSDKVGISSVKPTTFKSVLLAKKRLQAYSSVKIAKKVPKAEKKDEGDKREPITKKNKKELQPMDRAKAVIEEIEEIKRKELKEEIVKQELMAASVKIFEVNNRRSRSRSISPGPDRKFRRREIRSRNYRRTDSIGRKSPSPDNHKKSSRKTPSKPVYPENWLAYEQQNMNVKKDIEMKSKLFPTKKIHPYDMFTRFYNFYTPSPLIEPFKHSTVTGDTRETPLSFLRYTKSRPIIPYNVNIKHIKESCPSRAQLFTIIPGDRRQILEKFYTISRPHSSSKKMKTRNWYCKSWKTKSDAECKILENSVGLSFLQTYSDREDEENETEDIVICSSTQSKKGIKKADTTVSIKDIVESSEKVFDIFDIDSLPNLDYRSAESSPSDHILLKSPESVHISNETIKFEDENNQEGMLSGSFTPESKEKDNKEKIKAINETKKAIHELELELKRRQAIVDEGSVDEPVVFKKKKKAKQAEYCESQDDVTPKRKKNKKMKHKRHASESEDRSEHSEADKDEKKKRKKSKRKKNKDKKSKKKHISKKEGKSKKKERTELDIKDAEKQKKKKVETNSSESDDENESSRKSTKKHKKNKKGSGEAKKRDVKVTKKVSTDSEEYTDWEHEESVPEISKETPENVNNHKNNEIHLLTNIVNTKTDPFHLELNIDQRYLKRNNVIDFEATQLSDNILCLPKIADIKKEPEWDLEKNNYPPSACASSDSDMPKTEKDVINSTSRKSPKFNNSWESDDEEIFVRQAPLTESIITSSRRKSDNTFDLEIPLNIKPFKKREIIDISCHKSPIEIKSSDDNKSLLLGDWKIIQTNPEVEICDDNLDKCTLKRPRGHDIIINEESKKGRWDKRRTQDERDSFDQEQHVQIDEINVKHDTKDLIIIKSSVLENEYEEFMKAVTSNVSDSNDTPKNNSNSSSSAFDIRTPPLKYDNNLINSQNLKTHSAFTIETTDNMAQPTAIILPKDIPFIPMPSETTNNASLTDIKPIPVPSPKVKIEEIVLPLLNLHHIPSTTLSSPSIKDITCANDSFIGNQEFREHKTESEISSTMSKTMFNEACSIESVESTFKRSTELTAFPSYSEETLRYIDYVSSNTIEPTIDASSSSMSFNVDLSSYTEEKIEEKIDKPFLFVGMTLTKKVTLDKSRVKLNDSDDDDIEVEKKSLPIIENLCDNKVKDNIPEKHVETFEKKKDLSEISSSGGFRNVEKNRSKSPPATRDSSKSLKEKSTREKRDSSPKRSQSRRSSPRNKIISPHRRREASPRRHGSPRRRSPDRRYSGKTTISPRKRRSISPRKRERSMSPRNRGSPRRRSPARKRSISPRRRNSSPLKRSITPRRRNLSPRKRTSSPRRSLSPKERLYKSSIRHSISPRRKRNLSPRERELSPPHGKRRRSISPDKRKTIATSSHISVTDGVMMPDMMDRQKSPITLPHERPKQSVADSTISDDLLPQPNARFEDYNNSPISSFQHRVAKTLDSPKRIPLDIRINQVLGVKPEEKANINTIQTYNNYQQENIYYQHHLGHNMSSDAMSNNLYSNIETIGGQRSTNSFVQVGNMVQIVPTELPFKMDPVATAAASSYPCQNIETTNLLPEYSKSTVVQVGNMLQIVPTNNIPTPTLSEISPTKVEPVDEMKVLEKQSSDTQMKLKAAESRAEKERRRKEKEARRNDKEKKRKERERKRQIKLKQKTEDMIKRALQMEVEGIEEEIEIPTSETPAQWPPLSIVPCLTKEAGKSILVQAGLRDPTKSDRRKMVQFADGIKPGEGTSPSGGEDLMSPPPARKLPKEKRYKKTKLFKTQKKKVKVKIIKKISPKVDDTDDDYDDDVDHLPPPSPPPGSPPPHIFPPRVKIHIMNNVQPTYLVPPPSTGGGAAGGGHHQPPPQQQHIYGAPPPTISLMTAGGGGATIHPNSLASTSAMVMATGGPPLPHVVSLTSAPPPPPPPLPTSSMHQHHHHSGTTSTQAAGAMLHQGTLHHPSSSMSSHHHHSVTAPGTHGISHPHANYHF